MPHDYESANHYVNPADPSNNHSICAASRPSEEIIQFASRAVEIHLRNGNWQCAANALRRAFSDFQDEQAEARARLSRTPAQWLDLPIAELEIPVRLANALELAGAVTIREALALINSGVNIPNFGVESTETVWAAAEAVGIKIAEHGHDAFAAERIADKKRLDHNAYVAAERAKKRREAISGAVTPEAKATAREKQRKNFIRGPVDLVAVENEARGCTAKEETGRKSREQWQGARKRKRA